MAMTQLLTKLKRVVGACFRATNRCFIRRTTPAVGTLAVGSVADLSRSKAALVAENALLRHQLIVLRRQVARLRLTALDRFLLLVLASKVRFWRSALLIVQPETLPRWHRLGFCLFWKARSRPAATEPRVPADTVALIGEMARDNRLWGAERIRRELLKLGMSLSKRTIQKYMRRARPPHRSGQTWAIFLRNHAADIWACDFIQVTYLCFRPLCAFFIVEHASRRVVHVGVTRHPTDVWVAQQLGEATPFGATPRFLIHDNDATFGTEFTRVATTNGIDLLRPPTRRLGPTPSASDSSAACDGSAWTTCSSCTSATCLAFAGSTSPTSTTSVRIKGSARPSPSGVDLNRYVGEKGVTWSSFPSSAACIMPIDPQPELTETRRMDEVVSSAGLPAPVTLVREGELDERSGYHGTLGLLEAPDPPTAIVCVNDRTALGAMAALTERGLRVPTDVSLIGFDDIPIAGLLRPHLTTVRQPMMELGRVAAGCLLERIAHPTGPHQRRILRCERVVRDSTVPPP